MHEYAKSFVTDPFLRFIYVGNRADILRRKLPLATLPEAQQSLLCNLCNTTDEMMFYGKMELVLTFEGNNRKITNIQCYTTTTSIRHNGVEYKFD